MSTGVFALSCASTWSPKHRCLAVTTVEEGAKSGRHRRGYLGEDCAEGRLSFHPSRACVLASYTSGELAPDLSD
ncbi:uncharacterized protein PHALS_09263 [Plasmopara halstedii]|uniref:Uncharacterized protein n=1 Tax=Plasmopara halstedii TaxID=4781 RepID=A0A0P1AEE9_PLAHL|nr:uncharacterized protein PHALS_09263 [Plasmopara halstedii]CEG39209.1 hypothetical protein PHALS_09263 [Plasmopara halstedii]|eukprot:XP_024575578.1 hypothetical protein PHALS_09263 [Plasmopara halstedii]